MFFWKEKKLEDYLSATHKIKAHGMRFTIKKIDVLDVCTGAKVCANVYDTYKVGKQVVDDVSNSKVKAHFADVLLAGIVYPALCRKVEDEKDGKILVDKLLTDWDLAGELYEEIMSFTYGKKKYKQLISQSIKSLK
jgi:hypothetical protein